MYKIFRLITSFRFYAALIASLVLVMLLTRINTRSFRWIPSLDVVTNTKVGDNIYIAQQSIADQTVLLAYLNITLGHDGGSNTLNALGGSDIQGTIVDQAVAVTKYLNSLRSTDVLTLQNKSPDGTDLTTLIQQGTTLLQKGDSLISPLNAVISEQQSILDTCTAQKSAADESYNKGLQLYDSTMVQLATTTAQEASTCMSNASVSLNSAKGVLNTLQLEITKTQSYISLLTNNKSLLIQYGGVIDTNIPSQLVQLKTDLSNL